MTAKNTMNQETKNNSIINVVVNGMTATEAIEDVKKRLEAVEKSAFNIAIECAYTLGVTIPAYTDNKGVEHGETTCDKPIKKQADLLKLIGRSKGTLSKWIKAVKLIIENGYFTDFASGVYPFSYEKVIAILENKDAFSGYLLSDLMSMTVDTLEAMTATKPEDEKKEEKTPTEELETEEELEEEETEEVKIATISYDGKEYSVPKEAFEKWLAKNMITEK